MKKQKKASGTSYSKVLIGLIGLAIVLWGIEKWSSAPAPESTNVLTDSGTNLKSEEKALAEPTDGNGASEPEVVVRDSQSEAVVAEEKLPTSVSEFEQYTAQVLKELPVLADFKKLTPQEVHHTPEILLIAGQKMGTIAQLLSEHPYFFETARIFYSQCYVRQDLPTSLRALCLANHRNLRGASQDWDDDEIQHSSQEVRELAEKVSF